MVGVVYLKRQATNIDEKDAPDHAWDLRGEGSTYCD